MMYWMVVTFGVHTEMIYSSSSSSFLLSCILFNHFMCTIFVAMRRTSIKANSSKRQTNDVDFSSNLQTCKQSTIVQFSLIILRFIIERCYGEVTSLSPCNNDRWTYILSDMMWFNLHIENSLETNYNNRSLKKIHGICFNLQFSVHFYAIYATR